ncbi:MAG: RdgB/HAM1 family non-canonical purine NTP pyrophosphatase [Dehalococcoidia bacterium]|nr:RdgB/HAM1 family non-canonical purine NTP pyrophosphatase [Dehalococcoidia bacterium]
MPLPRLLLATNNPGKVREFRRLLAGAPYEVVSPGETGIALDVEETGSSYAENASLKATAFARAGECLALADDSGIEVDALDGGPGMYSARFGGPGLGDRGRTALLLEKLRDVTEPGRGARYRAVVALAWPGGEVQLFEGVQEGSIGRAPRGERGFGYDPVFVIADGRVQAEISDEEKDAISHRGKAVRAASAWLAEHCP